MEVAKIIQQRKQAGHEKDTSSDNGNVQILEQVIREYKNQLITVAQAGGGGNCSYVRTKRRRREPSDNGKSFRRWSVGAIHGQITVGMHELSTYIDQDVEQWLMVTCDISRVGLGSQFARFNERRQKLERGVESVGDAVGDRLVGNDHRNNAQEWMSEQITATLLSLYKKTEQIIQYTQQIHDNQPKWRKDWERK